MRGKVKRESAPRARMAAMAVEESSSSASMAPWVAMMAETPQTLEPTARRVVSLGLRLKRAAEPGHEGEGECEGDEDEKERDAAEAENVAEDEAGAEQDDAGLKPELVRSDTGAEDARQTDGVGDEDAEEDGPKDVFDVGEGDVVGFGVGVDGVFDDLAGVADEGEEGDAGEKLQEGGGLGGVGAGGVGRVLGAYVGERGVGRGHDGVLSGEEFGSVGMFTKGRI